MRGVIAAAAAIIVAGALLVLALDMNRAGTAMPTSTLAAQTAVSRSATTTPAPTTTTAVPTPTATPTASPTSTCHAPTARPTGTLEAGSITGRFAYGSDFIPAVTVYAISTADPCLWYSVEFPGFGNPPRPTLPPGVSQPTFTITGVGAGTYWVVAYRNDREVPDPGYYSAQVECFRTKPSGPCPDVSLAPVTVVAGRAAAGVDVITWGPPPPGQASPTFPPRPSTR